MMSRNLHVCTHILQIFKKKFEMPLVSNILDQGFMSCLFVNLSIYLYIVPEKFAVNISYCCVLLCTQYLLIKLDKHLNFYMKWSLKELPAHDRLCTATRVCTAGT